MAQKILQKSMKCQILTFMNESKYKKKHAKIKICNSILKKRQWNQSLNKQNIYTCIWIYSVYFEMILNVTSIALGRELMYLFIVTVITEVTKHF